jgi:hypothetical protein
MTSYLPREQLDFNRQAINRTGPFLNLTQHDFATGIANQVVKKSKHVAIDKERQVICNAPSGAGGLT